jgi:two-component system, NtrC family, sensor kinase
MRLTLGRKFFLYISSTLLLLLLLTLLVLERNQSRQWREYLIAQNLSFARFATPELLKIFRGSFPKPQTIILRDVHDFLGINRDLISFSLHSPNGKVLYQSPPFTDFIDLPDIPMDNATLLPRLQQPRPTAETLLLAGGVRILELVVPAFGPTGEQVLAARYLVSFASVDARIAEVRMHFLRIAVVAAFVSLLLVALVARRITGPLSRLTEGARAIARGDLRQSFHAPGTDEINTLAKAFNDMAESLERNRGELTEKNLALWQANEELRQMQEHLIRSERLAAIGQLAAGVSHEIDNPVGIILGYAELLLEDLPLGDARRDDVLAIIDECQRCKRITGGLLGFARSASVCREEFSLNALARETLEALQPQKLFRSIAIVFQPATEAVPIIGDADQLRQVFINLLLNAAQAMGGEGELTVSIERRDDAALVRVTDTGPGIPQELREEVFAPFYSTKGPGQGTGLGLPICRKLVEDHGGDIRLEEGVGAGAQFIIRLPLANAEQVAAFAAENYFDSHGPIL